MSDMSTAAMETLVQKYLGPKWRVKIVSSGGGLCEHSSETIWVDHWHKNIPWVLHEVAHGMTSHIRDHNSYWADLYTGLLAKEVST